MYTEAPDEIYVSNTRRGGYKYHTHEECPNLPQATKTLTPGDTRYEKVIKERDECQWCRYDTLEGLELTDADAEL